MFELWIAVTMAGCTLDLIMPPSEGERFLETLVTDFDSIAMALSKVWPAVVLYPHWPTNMPLRSTQARTCTRTRTCTGVT